MSESYKDKDKEKVNIPKASYHLCYRYMAKDHSPSAHKLGSKKGTSCEKRIKSLESFFKVHVFIVNHTL